jgi:DNA-binding LytR/AlgR family response regulator
MLRIALCDDEKIYRSDLKKMVQIELELSGINHRICEFERGEALLAALSGETYDIIFLDIEMDGLNGMETARKIRLVDTHAVIIFVTSHSDFVFQGYEVRALNYILKPYEKERILEALHLALNEQTHDPEQYYLIEQRSGTIRLALSQIHYFFSDKRSVTAVTDGQAHIFYGKIGDVEQETPAEFVRIHSRYLINLRYLTEIKGSTAVVAQEELPVSRAYKQTLATAFARQLLV